MTGRPGRSGRQARPAAPTPAAVAIASLAERGCIWPIGDPVCAGFRYCGRPQASGRDYCEHHHALAHRPPARADLAALNLAGLVAAHRARR